MDKYKGRPKDCSGREAREVAVYDLLDDLQVEYERVDHESVMTMEGCQAIDQALDVVMCKNLFLCNRQKTNYYLLLMPADKSFKTKEFSAKMGCARVSFAHEEALEAYLGLRPGAVTVLGLMNDKDKHVQLVIDKDVVNSPYLGCHPCVNTSSLKIGVQDLLDKILPAVDHAYTLLELTGQ